MGLSKGFPHASVYSLSAWYSIAPVVNWEASMYRMNCWLVSGGMMTGSKVTSPISLWTACLQCSLHVKSRPFCNKSVKGFTIFAKLGIHG